LFEKVMKSPSEKAKTKLVTDSIVNVTADNRINKNYASKERVLCSNCGREMRKDHLKSHRGSIHCKKKE